MLYRNIIFNSYLTIKELYFGLFVPDARQTHLEKPSLIFRNNEEKKFRAIKIPNQLGGPLALTVTITSQCFFVHKTSVKNITRVKLALVANFTVALFALCLPQVHLPRRPRGNGLGVKSDPRQGALMLAPFSELRGQSAGSACFECDLVNNRRKVKWRNQMVPLEKI